MMEYCDFEGSQDELVVAASVVDVSSRRSVIFGCESCKDRYVLRVHPLPSVFFVLSEYGAHVNFDCGGRA